MNISDICVINITEHDKGTEELTILECKYIQIPIYIKK